MAVVISSQPSDELLQIGSPITYRAFILELSTTISPALEVQVMIGSDEFGDSKAYTPTEVDTTTIPGFVFYYFDITVNALLIRKIYEGNPFRGFAETGSSVHEISTDFFIRFTEWKDNGQGFLALQAGQTDSLTRYVTNAYLPKRQGVSLAGYEISSGTGFEVFKARQSAYELDREDSDYLYYWAEGVAGIYVVTYDTFSGGGLAAIQSSAIKLITAGSNVQSIGIGPANISATTWDQGGVVINNNTRRVSVALYSGSTLSRLVTYNVTKCGDKLNIRFVNQFGTVDLIKVDSYSDIYSAESETFRPLQPINTSGFTAIQSQLVADFQRYSIRGSRRIECAITEINESDIEFYRAFLRAPIVTLEQDGEHQPFFLEDGEIKIYDTEERLYVSTFTIVEAREDKAQF